MLYPAREKCCLTITCLVLALWLLCAVAAVISERTLLHHGGARHIKQQRLTFRRDACPGPV